MLNKKQIKQIFVPVLGFGLGGLIWGLEAYQGAGQAGQSPFMFILGALSLGLFGGFSLVIFSKDIKKIFKVTGLGIVGCLVGFLLPGIIGYWLYLAGGGTLTPLALLIPRDIFIKFSGLGPSLVLWYFWIYFLLAGAIITLFYAILLKTKIKPLIWRGGIGFALASLISPIIGNLFSNLLASYLITFSLIGIIFGAFLQWGILKAKQ